jgi:hypothetical protein
MSKNHRVLGPVNSGAFSSELGAILQVVSLPPSGCILKQCCALQINLRCVTMYCMPYYMCGNVVFHTGTCFYRSNLFETPCITNLLFVIPSKSHHTPPLTAKKLLALPDTNGTQGLCIGFLKKLWRGKIQQTDTLHRSTVGHFNTPAVHKHYLLTTYSKVLLEKLTIIKCSCTTEHERFCQNTQLHQCTVH